MKWFFNLFKGKQDEILSEPSDLDRRITEIKARIAAIKSRNGWDEEPYPNTQIQSKPVVEHKALPVNNAEMNALRAKLLGKKK